MFSIYPFLKFKEYKNLMSNKIIKTYETEKIDDRYFYDINYLKKDLQNKFNNNQLNKNEYFKIEYFQKKYPEDQYFQKISNQISYSKKKCNVQFLRKDKIIEEEDDDDTTYFNNHIKDGIYIEDIEEIEEIENNNNSSYKKYANSINTIALATTLLITYLIIKNF